MSTITGNELNYGFWYDAYKRLPYGKHIGNGMTTDEETGALDAPGCIACGSSLPSKNLVQGKAAITVVVRSTGYRTYENDDDLRSDL